MSEARNPETAGLRRLEWLLFVMSLTAFAWFHSGGGWNQNARFALVRAIVEEGRLPIDSFLFYDVLGDGSGTRLIRSPIRDGEVLRPGGRFALYWKDADGRPVPLAPRLGGTVVAAGDRSVDVATRDGIVFRVQVPRDARIVRNGLQVPLDSVRPGDGVRIETLEPDGRSPPRATSVEAGPGITPENVAWAMPEDMAATGDVSYRAGHFHPAKAPGGSLLALPAYLAFRGATRVLGADLDDWWTITLGAWFTSVFSVGILAAFTVVLLFRLALRLSNGLVLPSAFTVLAFALGTPFLPYATMLYEHAPIAFLLVAALSLLLRAQAAPVDVAEIVPTRRARLLVVLAGASAGMAAVANYVMAVVALIFLAYVVATVRFKHAWRWFAVGLLGPLVLLCAYNAAAFGTPFTTNYAFEDPQFLEKGSAWLGVFRIPQLEVLPLALVSPFRGILLAAPVLCLGVLGLAAWLRSGRMRAEAWLVVAILTFFFALLTTFNGWHGGWGASPRYLVPAMPFLALPAVLVISRFPVASSVVGGLSIALTLLVVAVDPQAPVGLASMATIRGLPEWRHSPISLYEWPIFVEGRATPILEAQREDVLSTNDGLLLSRGADAATRARSADALQRRIDDSVRQGLPAPLILRSGPGGELGLSSSNLPAISGPVSANPVGIHESLAFRTFRPGSPQARWNSFNVGEFLFPESRWSLAPLLVLEAILGLLAMRSARRLDRPGVPHA